MTGILSAHARAMGLALMVAGLSAAALAEEVKIPDGQLPPPEQAAPQKKPPCVSERSGFRNMGGVNQYWVELTNACETRQRCRVNVYVVGSRGGKTGQATLVLARASRGKAAQKSWTIRTTENGGMATMSRKCSAI